MSLSWHKTFQPVLKSSIPSILLKVTSTGNNLSPKLTHTELYKKWSRRSPLQVVTRILRRHSPDWLVLICRFSELPETCILIITLYNFYLLKNSASWAERGTIGHILGITRRALCKTPKSQRLEFTQKPKELSILWLLSYNKVGINPVFFENLELWEVHISTTVCKLKHYTVYHSKVILMAAARYSALVSFVQCKTINYFSLPSVYSSPFQHRQIMQIKGSGIFYDDTLRTARKSKSCQLKSRCEMIPIPAHRKATHSENVAVWTTGAQCFSHPSSLLSL